MIAKKKIIIAGGGFAGIQLAGKLDESLFEILLIDRLNHHQFQPLFYQVASSQIEPSSISFPLRYIFKNKKNVQVRMAEILAVDRNNKQIITEIGNFSYDYLVIAMGCKTNFYGNDNIEKHSLTLKTTYEAIRIRNRILQIFEKAVSATEDERESLLNLLIVGAGPTGVELAGAFAEIKKHILPKDYPGIDFSKFNIILYEGSPYTLGSMSGGARASSLKYLTEMGVTVITGTYLKQYDGNTAVLSDGKEVKTRTVIWVAGITANQIGGLPETATGSGNRIKVGRYNKVNDCEDIFAVGDIAYMETPLYPQGHPQVANVAIGQARLLAKNLYAKTKNQKLTEYEYKDLGSMATIGNNKAVVDLPFIKFRGYFAWLVWMFLHLMLILSVKNKLIIFINWAWKYITKNTSLRLILSSEELKTNTKR
ncbi:MAG TPA: NAD(P)/FAD-dependent oxidoreductase [Bacteroidales bacterium]|nr:NAD(P)/FAD-dependent oxidoreductase [Bacteroidales bacterium]